MSQVATLFSKTKIDYSWSFSDKTRKDTAYITHGYHRYPAKFIPQLVKRLFDEYLIDIKEPYVNNLFMGSGTTIACAISRGYRADSNHNGGN
ncbi:MAG: hypothetical protein HZB81_06710 [Deltaproteobacteria bacterium]|nr:hypothetical protein [Deltaproteobacteria bacterium]